MYVKLCKFVCKTKIVYSIVIVVK